MKAYKVLADMEPGEQVFLGEYFPGINDKRMVMRLESINSKGYYHVVIRYMGILVRSEMLEKYNGEFRRV